MWSQPLYIWGWEIAPGQFVVLVSFAALLLGYLLGALVNRRRRRPEGGDTAADKDRMTSNVAFMAGINYILSGKPDQAIQELTRAVRVETETVETYVALANLFRSRGDIERAVRIRQTIFLRPNLERKIRLQALYDLGLDYRQGGFYDRAIGTFEDVIASEPKRIEAYLQLVQIYEETRDWEKAFEMEQKVARLTGSRANNVLAHHQVELGKEQFEKGRIGQARAAFKKALSLDPACVDAYLHLGDLELHQGHFEKAVAAWRQVAQVAPDMTFLTFGRLAGVAPKGKNIEPAQHFLSERAAQDQNPLARLALARLLAQKGEKDAAIVELAQALSLDPTLFEARRELGLLLLSSDRKDEALAAYQDLLDHVSALEATFQCSRCGYESQELMWRCTQCRHWDTMVLRRRRPLLFGTNYRQPEAAAEAEEETEASEES